MEVEVRVVGGIENCFVSLPLHFIQTLQSTRSGHLPQLVSLELRSSNHHNPWVVAWSGATSSSSSIEVAQHLAECISLPDHSLVQVRVVSDVPKATLVTVEPVTEDDWEVLELNSEHAETAMLSQVRIVQEAMRFPLWLHGHTVITFLVVSTFPKKSVVSAEASCLQMVPRTVSAFFILYCIDDHVDPDMNMQLVPGTEVAVAPKRRKKNEKIHGDSFMQSSDERNNIRKTLLRLQDSDKEMFRKYYVKGLELGVALTSVAFVSLETAKNASLQSLQLVTIVPRLSSKESMKSREKVSLKSNSISKEVNDGTLTDKKESRQAIVRLLISDTVAKGHIVIAQSLRLYLNAGLHSWVYVKGFTADLKKEIPILSLSPCHFKMLGKDKALEIGFDALNSHKNHDKKNMLQRTSSGAIVDWSTRDEVVAALSCESSCKEDEETVSQPDNKKGLERLLHTWMLAQLDAVASNAGSEVNTLVLSNETLLHFEVNGYKSRSYGNVQASSNGTLENKNKTSEPRLEILYVLTMSEESLDGGKVIAYQLTLDERVGQNDNLEGADRLFGKLKFGDPVSFYSVKDKTSTQGFYSNVSSLSWMGTAVSEVINRIEVLLSPASGMWFNNYNLPLPGHVLIHGPPGSGKTLLARAVAKSLEEHEDLQAHMYEVNLFIYYLFFVYLFILHFEMPIAKARRVVACCSRLALEKGTIIRQALSRCISEALDHAPSVVIFDDLDSIVSSSSDSEAPQSSSLVVALVKFLADVMDEYGEKRKRSCGIGPIAFVAAAQSLASIPQSLTSSGRFDFHVQLPAPAASERRAILEHEIRRRSLQCSDEILLDVAAKCDGYDAYDLEILVDRAVHAAVGRFLPSDSGCEKQLKPTLVRDDFSLAMHEFLPVAMRDITKSSPESGRSGWDDVGGLTDIRNAIEEMIELPSKFPNIFAQAPLRLRSNVLLYGPPGCGKTHIVGAAAAACSLRFISVKGPELLNKYIGASEQAKVILAFLKEIIDPGCYFFVIMALVLVSLSAYTSLIGTSVRDIFSKAAAAAPCLLFFDEFDSIAPKRGHDNTGVTDRVVNQFLTELDGVEVLTGVFVFAATSRPDLLDAALLRPGRLDRLLFCDFPSPHERLDILKVLSKKLPLENDVELDAIAHITEGFSGADLQALLSDAQLAAVHEILNNATSNGSGKMPVINDALLKSIASKVRPSVSEAEKQRLYGIYRQFLDSKRSVAAQSRDAKGKRATLA
ncbi:hypothetical protein EZV62_027550 [Acer yangbiense]|uniref:Peroxisomal ATPase PEX1 n=1 Tax=Acer yangbiense TaxID=1000413 RepID=A0A5C7GVZ6_9ROSI|nr:hypothetical protein EZV62_027550 [Acer yangbiense]